MKTKSIKQTVTFPISPDALYSLLLDSKKMSAIHAGETKMTKRPNGKFTVFDGYCNGYNIELVDGKKIKQAWHFAEDGWPDDHFSLCTFLLEPSPKGTKLTFEQSEVPAHKAEDLKKGWKTYYWDPIMKYLLKK
jgi:activator of HSP90 ATPase